MCDYSLAEVRSRLAMEGEELVVHRFPTHTIGLASPGDLGRGATTCGQGVWSQVKELLGQAFGPAKFVPAVCIPPGASLVLSGIPAELQRRWHITAEEPVVFTQISMQVNAHRDAVRFQNGHESLLQNLTEGIRVRVISLGGDQTHEAAPTSAVREPESVTRYS